MAQSSSTASSSGHLSIHFPKDDPMLRQSGARRLSFSDTMRYRKELEVNMQQEGGLGKALNVEGSSSLEDACLVLIKLWGL